MNLNKIDVLGGIMEKPQEIKNGQDIFESQFIELEEEAHIQRSEIVEAHLRAIYLESKTNVGFYFEMTLSVSSEELLSRFAHETNDQDIRALKALTRDEYLTLLKAHDAPSKQLIATLLEI